ncbi:MAG TPA: AAA family ATPase [Actinomycetota bacterium]|nr:AAA family ATPase [Actinomycetota bacterium]
MFCDVVGSTHLSRQRDVEAYFSILSAYYDACTPVVEGHGGQVAQHQGDGIYAWFGYPVPSEDDAIRAVRAGLDLLVVLRRLSARLESESGEPLAVRIAAHAGEVLVAAVGNDAPLAFGHTPNLAAKLNQAARPGTLVVSGEVLRLVGDRFEVEPREDVVLQGGSAVPVYEVAGERQPEGGIGRSWRTPLIGRARERERLERAWSSVQAGEGAAVALVGGRGIGKSRLASAVAAEAASGQATVLECACTQLDTTSAYRLFRTLLAQAAGIGPDAPPTLGAALLEQHLIDRLGMDEGAVTLLGGVLGLAEAAAGPPPDLAAVKLAQVTAELLGEWVARLAATAPTVLLIDDVPDADPSSLAVLGQLVAARPPRLLLVFTARSPAGLAPLLAEGPVERIELEPLEGEDAEAMIDAVAADDPLDLREREQVLRQGEGVPFYLEELARAAHVDQAALPITLTGQLQARLAAPGIDRDVVGVLAVAGQELDEVVLASVLRIGSDDLHHRLDPLLAADLVVDIGATGSAYRFRHGLIAEAAYALLLQEQRTELHRRIAEVLAGLDGTGRAVDWNVVGHHLRLAQRPLDAYEAILAGADEARRGGAIPEALQSYREALDLVAELTDPGVRDLLEVRCRLQRGITAVSARGFAAEEAVEDFERCAELCRKLGPRPEHLSAMTGVYSFYLLQGELAAARRVAGDLRSWVEAGHADYRPENALAFGVLSFFEGDYTGAAERLGQAARQFRTLPADAPRGEQNWLLPFDPLVVTLSHLATVLWITGRPREAHEAGDRAVARAATLAFPEGPFSMAYAKSYLAWMYAVGGHHETAARIAGEVREIGRRHGFVFWESTGEIHLALAEFRTAGRTDAPQTVAAHAAMWEFLGARVFLPYVLTAAAETSAALGDEAEAVAGFGAAGTLVEETGVRFYEAERRRLLARTVPPGAEPRAMLREAWELAHRQGALLFELRAALDLARQAPDPESAARLAEVMARFPPGAGYPELNEAQALLAQAPTRT